MSSHQSPEELLKAVETYHEQYLRSLRGLQEALAMTGRERAESRGSDVITTPPMRPANSPMQSPAMSSEAPFQPVVRRHRRSTMSDPAERRPFPLPADQKHIPASIHSEDELEFIPLLEPSTNRRAGTNAIIRRPIEPVSWADDQLLHHLKYTDFTGGAAIALEDVIKKQADIDESGNFSTFAAYESEGYVTSTFEVYDIDKDGHASQVGRQPDLRPRSTNAMIPHSQTVDAPTVWNAIKDVNRDGKALGRMTILQEPSALMLGALHLTMSPYFDMNELMNHLVTDLENKGKTRAYLNRAFVKEPSATFIRQRSFFFVFKYYTVVGDDLQPAPWQKYDQRPSDKRSQDHIDIAECCSVLALSLAGKPSRSVKTPRRREGMQEGFVFDSFAPWHLLSVQSFPDDEHTVRGEESRKVFVNGPYAFLDALVTEYRDATKRNQILHERITKLITPPTQFMFDGKLRDKLLFEDKHFTYIRRYFWAYNTLGVINNGIKAMLAAYQENFTEEFWDGKHQTLWPHPTPDSAEGQAYKEKMKPLRQELERACRELSEVLAKNNGTKKEIENLRDQLFSGSSIKESRRAIEQGDNIKILTLSSMIFLPLTFVTSVFGITSLNISAQDWRFAVTMVCVCVPFILVLILLQTRTGYTVVKHASEAIKYYIADHVVKAFREGLHYLGLGSPVRDAKGHHHQKPSEPKDAAKIVPGEARPRRKRRLTVRRPVEGTVDEGNGWTWWAGWTGWTGWRVWGKRGKRGGEKREVEVGIDGFKGV